MADIELVIKLSEKNIEHLKRLGALWIESENGSSIVSKALLEGTILPKGHGDLIDRSDLTPDSDYDDGEFLAVSIGQINEVQAIIEADEDLEALATDFLAEARACAESEDQKI